MTTRDLTVTSAIIFWDTTDCNNEGWAFRLNHADGTDHTGPEDTLIREPSVSEMVQAIVELGRRFDFDVDHDAVAVDLTTDGGCAEWTRI